MVPGVILGLIEDAFTNSDAMFDTVALLLEEELVK